MASRSIIFKHLGLTDLETELVASLDEFFAKSIFDTALERKAKS